MKGPKMNWFGKLMRLLPRDFREEFGDEMEEVHRMQRRQGRPGLWWRTPLGMLRAAVAQHASGLSQDLRLAARRLARRPLFTAAAVLSLAAGLGAATAVFSVLEAAFLRPLPGVSEMGSLVNVKMLSSVSETFQLASHPNYRQLRDRTRSLRGLAGFHGLFLSLRAGAEPEVVPAQLVTGNYFSLLGVKPWRGRLIGEAEDASPHAVAVISHSLWRDRFGRDPSTVGREILLNGEPFTIIGIAPPGFRGTFIGFYFDVFIPASMARVAGLDRGERSSQWVEMVGRLKEGVALAQAESELDRIARSLAESDPANSRGLSVELSPVTGHDDDLRGGLMIFLSALLGVGILVLAVACGNLANAYLARLLRRRHESALRLALGARRTRLARLQLSEALLLCSLAALLALLLASAAVSLVPAALSSVGVGLALDVRLNYASVIFSLALALAAGLVLGLLPSFRASRFDLAQALRQGDSRSASGSFLQRASLAVQVALSVLVLVTAGLFLRTLQQASSIDPGFNAERVLSASLNPTLAGLEDEESQRLLERIRQRAAQRPSIEAAGLTSRIPLGIGARIFPNPVPLRIDGRQPPPGREDWPVEHSIVSPGYFEAMGIPLLRGRRFRQGDDLSRDRVVIVTQAFVDRFWDGKDAINRTIRHRDGLLRVVGVAADGKYRRLDEPRTPYVYLPFAQHPRSRMSLLARSRASREQASRELREVVSGLAPDLPLRELRPLSEELDLALLPQRIAGAVAGGLGALGLLLVALGLYAAAAQAVAGRRREIGIRVSLGARPANVIRLVLRQGLASTLAGLLLGLALALPAAYALRSFWTGLSPADPLTFLAVPAALIAAALASAYPAARRAASLDPLIALRSD